MYYTKLQLLQLRQYLLVACGLLLAMPSSAIAPLIPSNSVERSPQTADPDHLFKGIKGEMSAVCQRSRLSPNFLVVGGGGAPSYNEIAIEKNVLYFQRTLKAMGYNPQKDTSIFFANGNNGQATVRYIDQGQEKFKPPEIPHLNGEATLANIQRYFQNADKPLFFYFTGHGGKNEQNLDNNALYLWNDQSLSVKQFAEMLDKMPQQKPIVTMMAQCYSGSFANFIYQGGDRQRGVALQTRCGFFATVRTLPSVGCTPEVNEADYRDYSSSFFAGLSGRDRLSKPVASADYNKDGKVAYAEAHAFAKVDEKSIDLPISTSEAWLQSLTSEKQQNVILSQPIAPLLQTARAEQRYVINSLVSTFGFDKRKSFLDNLNLTTTKISTSEQQAYVTRLAMELINIGWEKQIRASGNQKDIATLDRLLKCESGSWAKP